jgi:hypothetical protein
MDETKGKNIVAPIYVMDLCGGGGSRYIVPLILNLRAWRWVMSFTPQPLYPRRKGSQDILNEKLGGFQSRSERFGK